MTSGTGDQPLRASSGTPPPAPASPSDLFGKFVRTVKLGSGGGGEVWKAWDTELNRWVALKLLRVGTEDAEELTRFKREAQTAGALSHPHIAAIYEVGEADGRRPYIAMQLVDGPTLRSANPDRREAARLVRDAALAIDYAHQLGIVHRDLKPENLMVAGGHVYVMDFGLARAVHHPSPLTMTGSILGTPAYMSPEQARGRTSEIGVRSDVWSLGATLYDLVAGRPPFQGATPWDVVLKVTEEDAAPPAGIERDLRTIVMKCLEKEPAQRYASARALADDLGRWLDGEPIQAHPPSLVYRASKRIAKHKVAAAAVLIIVAVLLPVVMIARSGQGRAERALRLWTEISGVISGAGEARRAGDLAQFRARLDHGIASCLEHIGRDDHPHAHFFLGRLLRLAGRTQDAEAALTRALQLDPAFRECRFERGVVRAIRYFAAMADRTSRPLLASQYGSPSTTTTTEIEAVEPALAALRRSTEEDLSAPVGASLFLRDTDALYGRALLAQARGELEEAVRLLRSILERDPRNASSLLQLAEIAYTRGDFAECRTRAAEALEVDRGLVEAGRRRALAVLAGRFESEFSTALVDVDRFIAAAEPALANDLVVRGLILRRMKRLPEAGESLDRAIALERGNVYALVARAQVRVASSDLPGAAADLEEAIRISPGNANAYLVRAALRQLQGDLRGAVQDYDTAEGLLPRLPVLYYDRAVVKHRLREFAAAVADLDRAIELKQDFAPALALRAGLKRTLRRVADALVDADRALVLEPDLIEALKTRGWCLVELGRAEEGLKEFERILTLAPQRPDGWAGRGFVKYLQHDRDGAIADLETALRAAPKDWPDRGEVERLMKELRP